MLVIPLPEDFPGILLSLKLYTVDSEACVSELSLLWPPLEHGAAQRFKNFSHFEVHQSKATSERAEKAGFPLLYTYGDDQKPFD